MHDFPLNFHCFTGFLLVFTDFFGFLRERQQICDGLDITLSEFFDTEYFDSLEQEIK